MKNYSRKTNKSLTRYRTPAMFRLRAVIDTRRAKSPKGKFGKGFLGFKDKA